MDLSKLAQQIEEGEQQHAAGVAAVFKGKGNGSKAAAPAATSKRQGWKAATFYLQPETIARLKKMVLARKLLEVGGAADQSAVVDEALRDWLTKAEKKIGSTINL